MEEIEIKPGEGTVGEPQKEKKGWAAFIESDVADFFYGFELEKMNLEDGNGNKAKLSRTKDNSIKIEYTSTITL